MEKIKKGRTLAITIDEMLDSVRFKIAIDAYNLGDNSFLRAMLIEMGLETFLATRSVITKRVGKAAGPGWTSPISGETIGRGLTAGELTAYIRSLDIDILSNLNVHWGLTEAERELYIDDPKFQKTPEERAKLLERVRKRFGM